MPCLFVCSFVLVTSLHLQVNRKVNKLKLHKHIYLFLQKYKYLVNVSKHRTSLQTLSQWGNTVVFKNSKYVTSDISFQYHNNHEGVFLKVDQKLIKSLSTRSHKKTYLLEKQILCGYLMFSAYRKAGITMKTLAVHNFSATYLHSSPPLNYKRWSEAFTYRLIIWSTFTDAFSQRGVFFFFFFFLTPRQLSPCF